MTAAEWIAKRRELLDAATEGEWVVGDRDHIQGASHCTCRPEYGPLVWEGPVASLVARSGNVTRNYVGGSLAKAVDAGAATDLSETLLDNISPHHGTVSAVRFIVSGTTLAASGGTDYKTLKLWKRPASGGTPVLVASADTQTTAWTQWETVTFTLSAVAGAKDKLETDIYTVTEAHAGSGAIIPAGKLVVDLEVF